MSVKAKAEITLASIKDVKSVTRYYLLQSSTASIPSKPTNNPPGGSWVKTEPDYTTGSTNSLYFTDLTVFSDDSFTYSDVSLSSSYEAAKAAYNKSVLAQQAAQAAQASVDNIEVGGRNYLRIEPRVYQPASYYAYDFVLTQPLEVGRTYTIQLWDVDVSHTGKTADQLGISVYYCGGNVNFGRWQGSNWFTDGHADHLSLTFTPQEGHINHTSVTGAAVKYIRLYNSVPSATGTMNMSVGKWKLEKGTKATDWSPAPEDIVAESVDSVRVGGRNLYAVCNQSEGYIASGGTISAATVSNERTSDYIPVSVGGRYVLQSWVPSIPADKQSWIGYHFYSDTSGTKVGSRTAKYSANGGTYLCYDDIVVPEGAAYIRVSFRQFEDGYCKLETGNRPTDWTPAPEDTQDGIDCANSAALNAQEHADSLERTLANPNLSPFFSNTPYSVGSYWKSLPSSTNYSLTPTGDGWVRVRMDNSAGSAITRYDASVARSEAVQPNADYTFLIEFRNNNSTGTASGTDCYVVQSDNCQFWGNGIKKNLEGGSAASSTNLITDFVPGTAGVYTKRFVKTSEAAGSAHWTGNVDKLVCIVFRCAVGGKIDYEVRVSLYEGEYTGSYKPYVTASGDIIDAITTSAETVRLYAESAVNQRSDEIELSITEVTGTLTTDIQDCRDSIAETGEVLTGSVNALNQRVTNQEDALLAYQHQTSTYFRFNADGLNIGRQVDGDESPYSISIDNEKMGFLQNGTEIAYVQYNKMHINAIEAMDRLSVGAAADGGYFDFISTVYGMGVKWRSVNQPQNSPRSAPRLMATRSAGYEAVRDEEGIFSVEFGGEEK